MTQINAAVEEYKALRAEILAQMDRRNSRLATTWAGVSALLAAGAIAKIPELGCVALLLVCSGWVDELRWTDIIVQIGSYIKNILEPQIEGLHWEKALSLIYGESQTKPSLSSRLYYSVFFRHFASHEILGAISVVASIALYIDAAPISIIRVVLFSILLLLGIIYSVGCFVRANNFALKRRRLWDERFLRLSKDERFLKHPEGPVR